MAIGTEVTNQGINQLGLAVTIELLTRSLSPGIHDCCSTDLFLGNKLILMFMS